MPTKVKDNGSATRQKPRAEAARRKNFRLHQWKIGTAQHVLAI
jgi:hypothetical protein